MFPPMPEDEFEALVADVRAHGVLEAVTVYEGKVMDGWHRYQAAQQAGVDCPTQEWVNPDGPESAFAYVWSKNTLRRHLTGGQKIAIAAEAHPDLWAKVGAGNPGRPDEKNSDDALTISPTDELASIAGVHWRMVQDAKKVERHRPDLWEQVKAGKKTVATANMDRLYEKTQQEQTELRARRQAQDVSWQNDYVRQRLYDIDRLKRIKDDIHIGLEEDKFAPEAKSFVVRRIDRAISWLTEARNELEES